MLELKCFYYNYPWPLNFLSNHPKNLRILLLTGWQQVLPLHPLQLSLADLLFILLTLWPMRICVICTLDLPECWMFCSVRLPMVAGVSPGVVRAWLICTFRSPMATEVEFTSFPGSRVDLSFLKSWLESRSQEVVIHQFRAKNTTWIVFLAWVVFFNNTD